MQKEENKIATKMYLLPIVPRVNIVSNSSNLWSRQQWKDREAKPITGEKSPGSESFNTWSTPPNKRSYIRPEANIVCATIDLRYSTNSITLFGIIHKKVLKILVQPKNSDITFRTIIWMLPI
ncbi:hypothetical protein TSAR_016791 [Trichomalopsis sarcophagae]|uniref:Uncharacterized protein n=1 Tax=Trichomalopsis sarcophagae TaxID=543379 RepID=A0A232EWN8_9HYME|nr:hypothetical protein TSAR_016791 [Trichomalopsis sarcophagae]